MNQVPVRIAMGPRPLKRPWRYRPGRRPRTGRATAVAPFHRPVEAAAGVVPIFVKVSARALRRSRRNVGQQLDGGARQEDESCERSW